MTKHQFSTLQIGETVTAYNCGPVTTGKVESLQSDGVLIDGKFHHRAWLCWPVNSRKPISKARTEKIARGALAELNGD